MNKITYEIRRYEDEDAAAWDAFLLQTVNGTFLQSRRFLSYHPAGRFRDCSLMIYDAKGNLAALCPGADQMMDGRRVFCGFYIARRQNDHRRQLLRIGLELRHGGFHLLTV